MATTPESVVRRTEGTVLSAKQLFLETFEREHATTLRVLRAFPADRLELRPHPKTRSARELAWVFVVERMLGMQVFTDEFADNIGTGSAPPPPDSWDDILAQLEQVQRQWVEMIRNTPDAEMGRQVRFLVAPNTMGTVSRTDWCWFLLFDEIHHRGQFSVYLRMADAKVPSIYGPTADEQWI